MAAECFLTNWWVEPDMSGHARFGNLKPGAHRSGAPYPSARGVEEAANRLGLHELIVERCGFFGRQYVHGDLSFLQELQRLARHVKALSHST